MLLIIILFLSYTHKHTHSRRRYLRPSLTWIVWWKCLTKRRRWLAIHSAWRWRRPIESTFLKGRRVKNLNGGSTSSPCSPGLIWRCVCVCATFILKSWLLLLLLLYDDGKLAVWLTDRLFILFYYWISYYHRPDVIKGTLPSPEAKPRRLSRRNNNNNITTNNRRLPIHLV